MLIKKGDTIKAIYNGKIVAESNDTVVIEGNHYFPKESIKKEYFKSADLHTTCHWKGEASYFSIDTGEGEPLENGAWYYPDPPKSAVKKVGTDFRNYVAFTRAVKTVDDTGDSAKSNTFTGGQKALVGMMILVIGLLGWLVWERTNISDIAVDRSAITDSEEIPTFLLGEFPNTDWSTYDENLANALNGGPPKDGIPSIDSPSFDNINEFSHGDNVQAIVMQDGEITRAYPYNILNWHEIVNDEIDGTPVAITFCPLCGSAIVFNRTLPDGRIAEFGVSGALLESNMIMYDRETESLWQQSTGRTLAGEFHEAQLELEQFQLMTMGEIKEQFPEARVLSERTGYNRAYGSNPYAGYDENERFIFRPSDVDASFPVKEIFVAFRVDDTPVAARWNAMDNGDRVTDTIDGQTVTLAKNDNQLTITDQSGNELPFFFEMWFSWAVQNQDDGVVFNVEEA